MGETSKIEWTDATWNPIVGCTIVSPGCTNCYAMATAGRRLDREGGPAHYRATTMPSKAGPVWTGKVALAPDHILTAPLRWRRPRRIFVNSMGDLFHGSVPDEWIDKVFAVMALAPQHTFQVLTKRSARMRAYVSGIQSKIPFLGRMPLERIHLEAAAHMEGDGGFMGALKGAGNVYSLYLDAPWPLPNVWLGVSAERQQEADERIPDLLATPAAVRFLSAEPLIGAIDLERVGSLETIRSAMPVVAKREENGRPRSGDGSVCGMQIDAVGSRGSSITFFQTPDHMGGFTAASPRQWPCLDWVIVGGESGHGARPMHPDWARSLRDQCTAAGVPFFFKQHGEFIGVPDLRRLPGGRGPGFGAFDHCRYDQEHEAVRVGKKRAGRLLDGIERNGMPEGRG